MNLIATVSCGLLAAFFFAGNSEVCPPFVCFLLDHSVTVARIAAKWNLQCQSKA